MKQVRVLVPALMLSCASLLNPAVASGQGSGHGHDSAIHIQHPWSRPTPPGTPVGVGYMTIVNNSEQSITLVGAETPRAGHVSLHETSMQEGMMRMQPMEGGLDIPAGETVELRPHSYHLMLEQLSQPLAEGEEIPVILDFEGTGNRAVKLVVQPLDGEKSTDHSGMQH